MNRGNNITENAATANETLQRTVIVGGGTAGWMTAAALCSALPQKRVRLTLVESQAIGTIGVGEATLPHLRHFDQMAGVQWREMTHLMAGTMPTTDNFAGRHDLVWTAEHLYLLAAIDDDVLIDARADPLDGYWNDDALELFIDEDASGGLHQYDDNAYAYHIALDKQSVDLRALEAPGNGTESAQFATFPNHISAAWKRSLEPPHTHYWEVEVTLHPQASNVPARLHPGKIIGFMVAYSDADDAGGIQHFLGDIDVPPVNGDRNRG